MLLMGDWVDAKNYLQEPLFLTILKQTPKIRLGFHTDLVGRKRLVSI